MASASIAANAYANAAKAITSPGAAAKSGDPNDQSFASMLKNTLDSVSAAGRKSDAQAMAMASGKANIVDDTSPRWRRPRSRSPRPWCPVRTTRSSRPTKKTFIMKMPI